MRVMLVPVADRPECVFALKTTFELARRTGADVIGCHMRAQRQEGVTLTVDNNWLSGFQDKEWPLLSADEAETASTCARALFERLAKEYSYPLSRKPGTPFKPVALWKERVGTPPYIMPLIGPASDMLVVSRPAAGGGRKARALLMQALFSSHRPVLVLPQDEASVVGKRIAIGWNRGNFEARTLLAALPLLRSAEDVVFLTAGREGKHGPTAQDMIRYLAHHGIKARRKSVKQGRNPAQALVDEARREGADMLVCGAYSKGRLHEMVFGGVTQHLLTKTDMPVLMMHH